MKASLPPISRFIRAIRSVQAAAIFLPVATEPVKATQSTRGCGGELRADVAGAGEQVDDAGRQVLEAAGQRQGRERRQLRGLADDAVAGRQRRRELPGEQQQRVVPGHDAADDAERVLDHHRQLGRLDRRDHAAGVVAADLGVVVEGGRGPLELVAVLDQRLAALARSSSGPAPRRPRAAAARPRAAARSARRPASAPSARPGLAGGGDRGVDLLGRGARLTSTIVSVVNGFSTASAGPSPATGSPPISSSSRLVTHGRARASHEKARARPAASFTAVTKHRFVSLSTTEFAQVGAEPAADFRFAYWPLVRRGALGALLRRPGRLERRTTGSRSSASW